MLFNQSSSKKLRFFQMGWNFTLALYILWHYAEYFTTKRGGKGERLGHESAKSSPFHFFGQLYTRSTSLTLYLHISTVPETRKHGDHSLVCTRDQRKGGAITHRGAQRLKKQVGPFTHCTYLSVHTLYLPDTIKQEERLLTVLSKMRSELVLFIVPISISLLTVK